MTWNDAIQFPIIAGFTLCGLYFSMNYFGKDAVNAFLMCYIAVGGVTGVRSIMEAIFGDKFVAYDKNKLIDFKINMIGLEVEATMFDFMCLFISGCQMALYVYSKNWVYNNILCLIFCIHAL